ncbi:unnamed protein product, partial [Ectocarpus sp. 12 AP-2014]
MSILFADSARDASLPTPSVSHQTTAHVRTIKNIIVLSQLMHACSDTCVAACKLCCHVVVVCNYFYFGSIQYLQAEVLPIKRRHVYSDLFEIDWLDGPVPGFPITRRLSLCPPLHIFICGSPLTRGIRSDPLSLPSLSVWIYEEGPVFGRFPLLPIH